ncbi:hypothetical protein SCALM49S_09605 [Streptomyces californicus]
MHLRSVRRTLITTTALGLALASAPAVAQPRTAVSTNAPVKVVLTVQGPDGRLFKGRIKTKGHEVTTATGGTHACDGTNGGAHPSAVPTPTAALDDAARKRDFHLGRTWYASFDDYTVDTIKNVDGGGRLLEHLRQRHVDPGRRMPVQAERGGDKVAFTWTAF